MVFSTVQQQRAREKLVEQIQAQGIQNKRVLNVMRNTERHLFIDEALASHAYANHALPIGHGQTISQPYIVALMTQILLETANINSVLEIGTGCGYQTAVLSQLIKYVYTTERIRALADKAKLRLDKIGYTNIQYRYADGHWGWAENAPYDGIIVTAAPQIIPHALFDQLAIGGCLVIPVGADGYQNLVKIVRTRHSYEQQILDAVSFVPLREGIV